MKVSTLTRILFLGLLGLFFLNVNSDTRAQGSKGILRAGTAKVVDITPEAPVEMGGYGARKGLSEGIHDRIVTRVVAFENSGKRLVMVSFDLVGLGDAFEYLRDHRM